MKRVLSSLLLCGLLLAPCVATDTPAAEPQGKPAAAAPAAQKQRIGFRGNPATKVYHNSGCRHFNSKGASKVFSSPQEAVKAGYRPCKVCKG